MVRRRTWDEYFNYQLYCNSILGQPSLSAVGEGGAYQLEKNEEVISPSAIFVNDLIFKQ